MIESSYAERLVILDSYGACQDSSLFFDPFFTNKVLKFRYHYNNQELVFYSAFIYVSLFTSAWLWIRDNRTPRL
jgi:hypothetical protein